MTSSYIISLRHISNHKCAAAQRLGTNALDQPYLILPGFFFFFSWSQPWSHSTRNVSCSRTDLKLCIWHLVEVRQKPPPFFLGGGERRVIKKFKYFKLEGIFFSPQAINVTQELESDIEKSVLLRRSILTLDNPVSIPWEKRLGRLTIN